MALLSAGCGGTAQKSPSGNIRAEVFAGKEGLYYTVTHDGRTVIDTSAMGVTVDGTELFRDAALRPACLGKLYKILHSSLVFLSLAIVCLMAVIWKTPSWNRM